MLTLIIILTAIISVIRLRSFIMDSEDLKRTMNGDEANVDGIYFKVWRNILDEYIVPLAQYGISLSYAAYLRLTFINLTIFVLKYVPPGFYMYKFIKYIYVTSRERIKQKQIEIEDIQLQIQIVNTKLCVRDAESAERAEQLRCSAERLRRARARVRDVIATDDALRRTLANATHWASDHEFNIQATPREEDRESIVELLKDLRKDRVAKPDWSPEPCGEHIQTDSNTPENSVYSSLSDVDVRPDCRVKIVKVTNVYKVAYLKHYIKQKRLRRANKQAMLKKKMESIKKLLEEWQKTLNMVVNSKLTLLNMDPHPMDVASQEAMGDYSKPRESTDSDSDLGHSWANMYDEYSLSWAQNPYRPYAYNYEDVSDVRERDCYDTQDYGDVKYTTPSVYCERKCSNMMSILEETNSQIAIEEFKGEADVDNERRDIIVL